MCIDICVCIGTGIGAYIDMCIDVCIGMCADVCTDSCMGSVPMHTSLVGSVGAHDANFGKTPFLGIRRVCLTCVMTRVLT